MLRLLIAGAFIAVNMAAAQRDAGPLLASQVIATVKPGTHSSTGPLSARQLYTKKAGFGAVAQAGATAVPNLAFASLFPADVQVDAMSMGEDFIWADAAGRITPTGGQWIALTFSVQAGGSGGTATGVIATEEGRPDGAGADLFTFCVGTLPPPLLSVTRRAIDSTEMDMFAPNMPGDIDALDLQLAAYTLDSSITAALDPNPVVYFSVTDATKGAVPLAWWAGSTMSGATVFRTEWTGMMWTPPQPFATFGDLWLNPNDDVDALAIQCLATHVDVVFSTTVLGSVPSQVMVIRLAGAGCGTTPPTPLKTSDGQPVEGQLGNGMGNVDAVCLYDPSFMQPGSPTDIWAYVTGTPIPVLRLTGAPRSLEASAWRTCPGGWPSVSTFMTGFIGGMPADDTVYCVLAIGVLGFPPVSYNLLYSRARSRFETGGGRSEFTVPLPPGWPLSGFVYVDFTWIASLPAGGGEGQAFPVKIRV
jgi:hypothetical protein